MESRGAGIASRSPSALSSIAERLQPAELENLTKGKPWIGQVRMNLSSNQTL
jgi:hypothetical protein